MSKASRGLKKQAHMRNRYFHKIKKEPLFNENCSYKKFTLKEYRTSKKRKQRLLKQMKKNDRNFNSLFNGDINFRNDIRIEGARNMEDLRVY